MSDSIRNDSADDGAYEAKEAYLARLGADIADDELDYDVEVTSWDDDLAGDEITDWCEED